MTMSRNNKDYTSRLFDKIKNYKPGDASLLEPIELLVKLADLTAIQDEETPIQLARSLGHWDVVKVICETKYAARYDFEHYGDVLRSALHEGKDELVEPLLKANASVNWFTTTGKFHCMHSAVKNRKVKLIKLLLDYNASLTDKNSDEQTPIHMAAKLGYWDCVEAIAKCRATDKADAAKYCLALFHAAYAKEVKTVEGLLAAGTSAEVERIYETGTYNSILHIAVKNNDLPMIELLLQYKVSVYSRNLAGQTPLELACELGHWDCARRLMGKFNEYKFNGSETSGLAFIHAIKAGQLDIARGLKERGAPITKKNQARWIYGFALGGSRKK